MESRYGFTYENFKNGDQVAAVSGDSFPNIDTGDFLKLGDRKYMVIYTDKNLDSENKLLAYDIFIPLNSIPRICKVTDINIDLISIPTEQEVDIITEKLKEFFGYSIQITQPELPELLVEQFNSVSKIICIIVIIVVVLSSVMTYMFVVEKRSRWLAAVKMCGAENNQCIFIFLIEMMLILTVCFALGCFISKYIIIPKYADDYPAFLIVYNNQSYLYLFFGFAVATVVILVANVGPFTNKTIAEMQRRSG